ncbi:uncharacterized protein Dana_GF21917 [Drosophila ananassae]|uniref:Uncharacterized protein n=1 Tax=Drosophila ananassae TaxID=7217 RepID=B3MZ18_DROAN|nr:uncharacterized protein LOC6504587 [Drosophila ananassae]EDV32862.1 uncharacterized protein Dana_GF21917 [Drosophila ananassae]
MLKWAVNQPRPSYLARDELLLAGATESKGVTSYSEFHALRGKLKRKSLSAIVPGQGKENQMTSTPLPASSLLPRTPLLKDLSNILATPTPQVELGAASATQGAPKYACTLPTFEAEYSPSSVIPGPLIALRGVGIPDSYFEKPRYLEQKPLPAPSQPRTNQTLSSSQMGDVTLERMIDAILESNRKTTNIRPPRQHRHRHPLHHLRGTTSSAATHSPTYRPAFDPASDLREYWKSPSQREASLTRFEEREVCSPARNPGQSRKRHSLQVLRRQRVVRRKRKITTKISSSVRQSAQKLLAAAKSGGGGGPGTKRRHISPDSGHNSTTDLEEEEQAGLGGEELEAACHLEGMWLPSHPARDATKRRLSFSLADHS